MIVRVCVCVRVQAGVCICAYLRVKLTSEQGFQSFFLHVEVDPCTIGMQCLPGSSKILNTTPWCLHKGSSVKIDVFLETILVLLSLDLPPEDAHVHLDHGINIFGCSFFPFFCQ